MWKMLAAAGVASLLPVWRFQDGRAYNFWGLLLVSSDVQHISYKEAKRRAQEAYLGHVRLL